MKTHTLIGLGATLLTTISAAHAYDHEYNRYTDAHEESFHAVSVAGGIASPANTSLFSENPSGLIYNRKPKVFAVMRSHPANDNWMGSGAGFLIGNRLAAAGIGFQNFSNVKDTLGSVNYFNFGLASHIEALNLTVGLSGAYRTHGPAISDHPSADPTWTANLGVLFNPDGILRLSAIAYDINKNIKASGVGIAVNLNRYSILGFDASVGQKGGGLTLKPGIAVAAGPLQMSYAFGIQKDPSVKSGIPAGNTFGLGYELNQSATLQASYNQTSLYSLGLVIQF